MSEQRFRSRPRRLKPELLVAAVALFLAGAATVRSGADRVVELVEPARIAVVDLERTILASDEYACLNRRVDALGARLDEEAEGMRAEVEQKQADLDFLPAGSPNHEAASREALRLVHKYRGFVEYAGTRLQQERSAALANVYARVREAARTICDRENVDVVFVDDTVVPLPPTGSEEEMMRQISARRMLHARDGVDVTDDLIAEMNASFDARGGCP